MGDVSTKLKSQGGKPSKDQRISERIILAEYKNNLRYTGLPLLYIS